jgi:hypothetical protein
MTGFSGVFVGMGHNPSVTCKIRLTYSLRCSQSSDDWTGMNEKSPRSPLNGPSRVSGGIVPIGRTRGGLAIRLDSIMTKYDAVMIRINHQGGLVVFFCLIGIAGICIVQVQTQDLLQVSPYQVIVISDQEQILNFLSLYANG